MKYHHFFTLVALVSCLVPSIVSASTYDPVLATRMQGRILLQVESHGEAWYIRSKDLKRYYMKDGEAAYSIMRFFSLGITDVDLAKVPHVSDTTEMKASTSACTSNTLANRLRGKILLQTQQHGEAWYVDPVKCRAIYLKDGAVAYEAMRFLGLGILNRDLEKIEDGGTVAGPGGALSSTPSSFSCPTNSHQNPSGARNCLCDTGYQTNAAGNGCVIASAPPSQSLSCPANSHLKPTDSTKCLCDTGYQTNSAGDGCTVASAPLPPPPPSCSANSHLNPSDSTKCLCDTGYEVNSAGNGCVVASVPPPPSCTANSHLDPSDSSKCLCDTGYETNSTKDGCVVAEIFDLKIDSLSCFFTYKNEWANYNQAIVRGTAQGPVGALIELPILGWPDDVWDCGAWTRTNGAWIAVGSTCTRKEGQPETTTWSVDTGGEETGGYETGQTESYTAKIYSKNLFTETPQLQPRRVAQASTVCQ